MPKRSMKRGRVGDREADPLPKRCVSSHSLAPGGCLDMALSKAGRAAPALTNALSAADRQRMLIELERKVLWLSSWTIHHANHIRPSRDGVKVGGHQASSASVATLMTALYFVVLPPHGRVAVKPHASPRVHALEDR